MKTLEGQHYWATGGWLRWGNEWGNFVGLKWYPVGWSTIEEFWRSVLLTYRRLIALRNAWGSYIRLKWCPVGWRTIEDWWRSVLLIYWNLIAMVERMRQLCKAKLVSSWPEHNWRQLKVSTTDLLEEDCVGGTHEATM